jgi:hypothetical protein
MARLTESPTKFLELRPLAYASSTARGREDPLLLQLTAADDRHTWSATASSSSLREMYLLATGCIEVANGHNGGLLAMSTEIEFGIYNYGLFLNLEEPFHPPTFQHDREYAVYQTAFHPTPAAFQQFGLELLAELQPLEQREEADGT